MLQMALFIKSSKPENLNAVFCQLPHVSLQPLSNLWYYNVTGKAADPQECDQSVTCNIKPMKWIFRLRQSRRVQEFSLRTVWVIRKVLFRQPPHYIDFLNIRSRILFLGMMTMDIHLDQICLNIY